MATAHQLSRGVGTYREVWRRARSRLTAYCLCFAPPPRRRPPAQARTPVLGAALDGGVAVSGDPHRVDERVRRPTTSLALSALNLPRGHAERAGQLVRVAPAGRGDPGHGAYPIRQRVGDRHRVDTDVQPP